MGFKDIEPSLQGKEGMQGAYAHVRGCSSTSNLFEPQHLRDTELVHMHPAHFVYRYCCRPWVAVACYSCHPPLQVWLEAVCMFVQVFRVLLISLALSIRLLTGLPPARAPPLLPALLVLSIKAWGH